MRGIGISPVTQQRKLGIVFRVGQIVKMQAVNQILN